MTDNDRIARLELRIETLEEQLSEAMKQISDHGRLNDAIVKVLENHHGQLASALTVAEMVAPRLIALERRGQ